MLELFLMAINMILILVYGNQAEDYGIDSHTFDSTTVNDQIEEQVKSLYR